MKTRKQRRRSFAARSLAPPPNTPSRQKPIRDEFLSLEDRLAGHLDFQGDTLVGFSVRYELEIGGAWHTAVRIEKSLEECLHEHIHHHGVKEPWKSPIIESSEESWILFHESMRALRRTYESHKERYRQEYDDKEHHPR